MAKISARGAHKVCENSVDIDRSSDDIGSFLGPVARVHYVLRSDGKILRAIAYPQATTAYDRKRGGYTIVATIKPGYDMREVFDRYCARKGCKLNAA